MKQINEKQSSKMYVATQSSYKLLVPQNGIYLFKCADVHIMFIFEENMDICIMFWCR